MEVAGYEEGNVDFNHRKSHSASFLCFPQYPLNMAMTGGNVRSCQTGYLECNRRGGLYDFYAT